MKNIAFAVAAIVASVSGSAFAETFQGSYIGAEIGHDSYEIKGEDLLASGLDFDGISGNGIVGGVFVGYDLPVSSSVFIGAEAFVNLSAAKVSISDGVDTASIKARESYGLSARLGTMLNDSTAVYARGGWVNTSFKLSDGTFSDSDTQSGFQYGGGIETRVGQSASVRLEYVASDYGSAGLGNGIKVGNSQVRAGASFRF